MTWDSTTGKAALMAVCSELMSHATSFISRSLPSLVPSLVNIVQHFCRSSEFQSDWLMWQLSHLY